MTEAILILFSVACLTFLIFQIFKMKHDIQISKEKEALWKAEAEAERTTQQKLNVELTDAYKRIVQLQTEQAKNTRTDINETFEYGAAIGETFKEIEKESL